MNRRTLLRLAAAAAPLLVGAKALGPRVSSAGARGNSELAGLGLPEATISVGDAGFTVPTATRAGRLLLTVENTGRNGLHFFAARIPDAIGDEQLAIEMAAESEPAWFDMSTLPMLGTPDWPAPGGRAQGVVDVGAGRWVLIDPIDGREVATWTVAEGKRRAVGPEPAADVELGLIEMDFTGLDEPVRAGSSVWKITNRGAMEHEIALLPVPAETTKEGVTAMLADMLAGQGDPAFFAPVGGQGIASRGVTSWQRFDLEPGTYAALCMTPMPGEAFTPHALMGMAKVFTVR